MHKDLNLEAVIKSATPRNGDLLANGCVCLSAMHSKVFRCSFESAMVREQDVAIIEPLMRDAAQSTSCCCRNNAVIVLTCASHLDALLTDILFDCGDEEVVYGHGIIVACFVASCNSIVDLNVANGPKRHPRNAKVCIKGHCV